MPSVIAGLVTPLCFASIADDENFSSDPLTIRHVKPISSNTHSPRGLVEPPNLLLDHSLGPEILDVAVGGIGKVDLSGAGVDGNVIDGVELTAKVVVQNDRGVIGGIGRHDIKRRCNLAALSLAGKEDSASVVRSAIRVDNRRSRRNHVNIDLARGIPVSRHLGRHLRKRDLLDDGRLVKPSAGGGITGVLDEEEVIRFRDPILSERSVSIPVTGRTFLA